MRNKVDLLVLGHILGCTFFLFFYSSIEQEAQTIQVLTKIFDMEHSTELPKCTFHNSWSGQYLIYLWKHIKEVQGKRKSRNDKGERCMPPLLACVCVRERERERERETLDFPVFLSCKILIEATPPTSLKNFRISSEFACKSCQHWNYKFPSPHVKNKIRSSLFRALVGGEEVVYLPWNGY
jgi:hypothetical protein